MRVLRMHAKLKILQISKRNNHSGLSEDLGSLGIAKDQSTGHTSIQQLLQVACGVYAIFSEKRTTMGNHNSLDVAKSTHSGSRASQPTPPPPSRRRTASCPPSPTHCQASTPPPPPTLGSPWQRPCAHMYTSQIVTGLCAHDQSSQEKDHKVRHWCLGRLPV